MPCSCSVGCGCPSAGACAVSACHGASLAGANLAAMGLLIGGYHRMWYPNAFRPGEPTPDEQEEIRGTLRDRDEMVLAKLREKLKQVESESPEGLIRSKNHLDREKAKLTERIRRLEHEVSILSAS